MNYNVCFCNIAFFAVGLLLFYCFFMFFIKKEHVKVTSLFEETVKALKIRAFDITISGKLQ